MSAIGSVRILGKECWFLTVRFLHASFFYNLLFYAKGEKKTWKLKNNESFLWFHLWNNYFWMSVNFLQKINGFLAPWGTCCWMQSNGRTFCSFLMCCTCSNASAVCGAAHECSEWTYVDIRTVDMMSKCTRARTDAQMRTNQIDVLESAGLCNCPWKASLIKKGF